MKDFLKVVQIIETDNDGWFAIRGMLSADKIVWTRSVGEKVAFLTVPVDVYVASQSDLQHIIFRFNARHG